MQTEHPLTKTRPCKLLSVARSTAYYRPEPVSETDLRLMPLIDEIILQYPLYGSRRIRDELQQRSEERILERSKERIETARMFSETFAESFRGIFSVTF